MGEGLNARVSRRGFLTATSVAGIAGIGVAGSALGAKWVLADTGEASPVEEAVADLSARLTSAQHDLQQRVRSFAKDVLYPRKNEMLSVENGFIPADIYRAAAEQGFFGTLVPVESGGQGLGVTDGCIIAEELSKVSPTLGLIVASTMVQARVIADCEAARSAYLPGVLSGDTVVASAVVSPDGCPRIEDWDVLGVPDGGEWVLNGSKGFVSLGAVSDLQLVYGVDADGALRVWFVPASSEGFGRGGDGELCGMRGLAGDAIAMENVRVDDAMSMLVGETGEGGLSYWLYAMVSAVALGATEGTYQFAEHWARTRTHDFEPLLKYQKQRHKLARAMTRISIMRAGLYEACAMLSDPGLLEDGCMLAQMCKAYIPAECIEIVHEFNILLAGWGYHHVEWFHYYQDVLGCAVMDLPTDYQYEGISELLGLTRY